MSSASPRLLLFVPLLLCLFATVRGNKNDDAEDELPNESRGLAFSFANDDRLEKCRVFKDGCNTLYYVRFVLFESGIPDCQFSPTVRNHRHKMAILKAIDFGVIEATVHSFREGKHGTTQFVQFSPAVQPRLGQEQTKFFSNFDDNLELLAEAFGGQVRDASDWGALPSPNEYLNDDQYEALRRVFNGDLGKEPEKKKVYSGVGLDFSLLRFHSTSYYGFYRHLLSLSSPSSLLAIGSLVLTSVLMSV
eukprot:GHVS01048183.1.p1 GENE.GHVS01048183.1~~GHVS01048183.1.p1  ORF type:complete len:248 (+),score=25.02 GHVS01048183.1:302-1045(+)